MIMLGSSMRVQVFDVGVSLEKEGNDLLRFEKVAGQLGSQRAVDICLLHSIMFSTECLNTHLLWAAVA